MYEFDRIIWFDSLGWIFALDVTSANKCVLNPAQMETGKRSTSTTEVFSENADILDNQR